ncbi:MAG: chemotaxis protein CheW [Cyanobacteria bacterium P01_A01_bin.114]
MNNLVLAPRFTPSTEPLGDPYLSFQLNDEISAVFSMDQVHEVLVISPDQVTPMPNMPEGVLGLLTRRSRVMWLVDLSHLLLSQPLATDNPSNFYQYKVVIVRVEQLWPPSSPAASTGRLLLGLVVHALKGSIRLTAGSIQPPQGHFSERLAPYLQGSTFQSDSLLIVLNADAIARSPMLHVH